MRPQLRLVDAASLVVPLACLFASIPPAHAADSERSANQRPTIRIAKDGKRIEVVGLPPAAIASVRAAPLSTAGSNRLLTVAVAGGGKTPAAPMLGKFALSDTTLVFTPRFPLRPGLNYHAVFDPAALPGNPLPDAQRIETTLALPTPPARSSTMVTAVYPSSDALPTNLLKFYIHFSAPMTRGRSYRHIRIVDSDARAVPDAFLELDEELWNAAGTRLTLLFDPGRIKRGLKPNEQVGVPLVEGRRYALVIAAGWPDAQRNPLAQEFRKPFRVTPPDYAQPDPRRWQIKQPQPGTRQPLSVQFDEPLDHALLEHMLTVRDGAGRRLAGRVTTSDKETQWQFHREGPWQPGGYELVVDPATEDRAGNSVGRPFETQGPSDADSANPVVLRFEIPPPR